MKIIIIHLLLRIIKILKIDFDVFVLGITYSIES